MKLYTIVYLLLICVTFRVYGNASQKEKRLFNLNSNHPVQILENTWQIKTNNRDFSQTLPLPVTFSDDISTSQFSYTFTCPEPVFNHALRIWFMGLNGYAEIYLNSVLLKEHPYFPNSFCVDVPEQQLHRTGENQLQINLRRAKFRHEKVPQMVLLLTEEEKFGINKEVVLEWLPPDDIVLNRYVYQNDSLFYHYTFKHARQNTDSKNRQKLIKIEEQILSPNGDIVFSRYQYIKAGIGKSDFNRAIKLGNQFCWSPDMPNLILLKIKAVSSTGFITESDFKMGLRSIKTDGGNLTLNDHTLKVKGITYRDPGYIGREKQMEQDVSIIKKMGFNAIRCPNFIPHPCLVSIADSLGILLFIENGLWRLPGVYYQDNLFIQNMKIVIGEVLDQFQRNPSLIALGLGHEIALAIPEANKFLFIINEQLKSYPTLLSYISPLDPDHLPKQSITNFYMINKYGTAVLPFLEKTVYQTTRLSEIPLLLGNISFLPEAWQGVKDNSNLYNYFFSLYASNEQFNGFFIETYRDWVAAIPGPFTIHIQDEFIYPLGIVDRNYQPRPLSERISHLLNSTKYKTTNISIAEKSSNFFSILAFISSIIFLLIYKRNFRFRENLVRSLVHPYGFFVDLRDRRIISTLNSTILGVFACLQMANFTGAYLYFYHDNLRTQEYLVAIFRMLKLPVSYLSISQEPWQIVLILLVLFYMAHLIVAIVLKLSSLIQRAHIRFRQGLAVSNWSGSHAVFFIPLSMFGYYLFEQNILSNILWPIFIFFFIWYNFRLANGIRVLFILRPFKIIIIMILTYVAIVVSLFVYADIPVELYEYFKLLGDAGGLFS